VENVKPKFSEPLANELTHALEQEIQLAITHGIGLGEVAASLGHLLQHTLEQIPKDHRPTLVADAMRMLDRANDKP
jgi:hypothetical protein